MLPEQNPYAAPQFSPEKVGKSMPVAGMAPGTIDQRQAFPEYAIEDLRRWQQHVNSLMIFVLAQSFMLFLVLIGWLVGAVMIQSNTRTDMHTLFHGLLGVFALLIVLSIIAVLNRWESGRMMAWIWIGVWLCLGILGAIAAAFTGHFEAVLGVLQLSVYAVLLFFFVSKALKEGDRYFGPDRINEYALKQELAYREINSIP